MLVLFLFLPGLVDAATRGVMDAAEVTVYYDDSLQAAAREVVALYPKAKAAIEGTLPWKVSFKPTVILTGRASFQHFSQNPKIVAFAVPADNLIVIDHSRVAADPSTLAATLKHEICHLQLHHYIAGGRLPRWLDEGYCQWTSDGIAEVFIDSRTSQIERAVLAGRLIPLHDLSSAFPSEERSLVLAYEESKSVVEYVIREHGFPSLMAVFDDLKAGYSIDKAIEAALSYPTPDLEEQWLRALRGHIGWVSYFSTYIYEFLFLLGALVTVYGFVRLMRRIRTAKDQPDDEETTGPSDRPGNSDDP
ncbi:MAG TPA: hypothetical protein VLD40_04090 [Dissulfurispiraceae bacterium]|nr:hypothetical protein [Dissulfurispiraceae bacterium]